ncbi:serine-rich adhesin for platelets [Prunus yedoensis var. nudiflora]|uniref:Serine-rich adhesin for platelets n=1 Tax=Prunus yedoensis var. nudiflora TaxID=2094558 RepID=A0A314ZIU6_PRUYE|nr:serine-rich adhesin for platelets [Prunus yedoensis var. nudiflora]
MNPVELLSNLYALRQLYGLLQNGEDGFEHINSNNVGKALDVRAQQLLKDLLDDATDKILNTHSKITAARSGFDSTPCSSQAEQPKAVPKLNSVSPATVKSPLNTVLNYGKDSKSCKITSKTDEQSPKKPEGASLELKMSTSTDLPEYKRKWCRICLESNLNKQYSAKELKISNERAKVPGKNSQSQDQRHDWLSHLNRLAACSSVSPTRDGKQELGLIKEKSDEASDYSKVVTNAIKQIESGILALQLSSTDLAESFNNDVDVSVSPTPIVHTEEQVITTSTRRDRLSDRSEPLSLLGVTELLTCPASQLLSQKHENPTGKFASRGHESLKAIMERFESLSQPVNQNNKMASYVNGLRVPPTPTQDEVAMKPAMQVKTDQTSQISLGKNPTMRSKKMARSKPSIPPQSRGSKASSVGLGPGKKLNQKRTRKTTRHCNQMIMRPVLLDEHKSSARRGSYRMSYVGQQNKVMPRKKVLEEETSSSTTKSRTWSTSEQTETESSASSNEYSKQDYWSPSQSSRHTNDIHMRSGRRSIRVTTQDSSSRISSCCSSSSPLEALYSHKRLQTDKPVGRLKKLKNKLGLIFHHHHHHHHHHHDGNANSDDDHGHSTWKHLRKMMLQGQNAKQSSDGHQGGERGGVKKSLLKLKTMSHNNKKQQQGHFHALAEGLLRHVRHSKKSNKLSKGGGIGRLRHGPHQSHHLGHRRLNKKNKLHWWHMFRQHGGVKLPKAKRGRVKLGFTTKRRPKLKMK